MMHTVCYTYILGRVPSLRRTARAACGKAQRIRAEVINGGFHSHGGTPIAGWLIMENAIYIEIWWLRVPLWLRKPQFSTKTVQWWKTYPFQEHVVSCCLGYLIIALSMPFFPCGVQCTWSLLPKYLLVFILASCRDSLANAPTSPARRYHPILRFWYVKIIFPMLSIITCPLRKAWTHTLHLHDITWCILFV